MKRKAGPFYNGKVHVQKRMCDTCIFRPGNLMRLDPGKVEWMVEKATKRDSCIPCHETTHTGRRNAQAVCRGFYEKHATGPLQIAERLGYIEFV